MTKFNLREAIAKNKATFFSSINENASDTAEKFAKHMSKKENRKFTVTPGSVDEKSFDLDIDGLEYEGGSYLIDDNGDIINVSMGNKVYGNVNQLEENDPNQSRYMEPEEDYNDEDDYSNDYDDNEGDGYIDDNDSEYDTGVDEGKKSKKYYKDAEADDAEHIKALEKDMKDDKKSSKMKKSELKAKIKEMVLAEMNLDIQNTTDEYDFLAEKEIKEGVWSVLPQRIPEFIKAIEDIKEEYHGVVGSDDVFNGLDSAIEAAEELLMNSAEISEAKEEEEVDVEDIDMEDIETTDIETSTEVDPDVKAVQDLLTQAQAAAQALGDEKLTDQIGNTITFFTRTHVVDKGAVSEGEVELNEDLSSSLIILLTILISIPGLPIAGALIMGLFDYIFNEFPDQRAEAKSLRSYKGPDKQEKVLALAKEIEAKLSPGKKRYLKTLVNRIGASKLEDKAREYRELDRYASREKNIMDRGLDENLNTDIEAALKDLPIPMDMEEGKKEDLNESMFPLFKRIMLL